MEGGERKWGRDLPEDENKALDKLLDQKIFQAGDTDSYIAHEAMEHDVLRRGIKFLEQHLGSLEKREHPDRILTTSFKEALVLLKEKYEIKQKLNKVSSMHSRNVNLESADIDLPDDDDITVEKIVVIDLYPRSEEVRSEFEGYKETIQKIDQRLSVINETLEKDFPEEAQYLEAFVKKDKNANN